MGRAPCCEKTGLKKGPWTPEEDEILVSFIHNNGHTNWRALPRKAGLLRCGKSCRLRWINYLRPDIKRGNFTQEEENTIIQLHATLGNRWSAIASNLSGRTDNEIKNMWHTYLKKKLPHRKDTESDSNTPKRRPKVSTKKGKRVPKTKDVTPAPLATHDDDTHSTKENSDSSSETFSPIDDDLWLELELAEGPAMSPLNNSLEEIQSQRRSGYLDSSYYPPGYGPVLDDDDIDFWYDVFLKSGGMEEIKRELKLEDEL